MTWEHPALLWFLILPVAGLLWTLLRPERDSDETLWPKINRVKSGLGGLRRTAARAVSRPRPFLMWMATMLAIASLARPQWGETEEQVYEHAREVLIALDLSRSMLVSDVTPSRLERSKLMIQSLLDHLEGERVGLIVFAGTAFLQSPLSADYQVLRGFLPELDPDYLPQGGTDYEAMLKTALDSFGPEDDSQADRYLIVLSDGESLDGDWKPLANEMQERSIQVIGLGVGTDEGGLVPDAAGGLMKDASGAVVLSRLDSSTLQDLTRITNGVYRHAAGWIDLNELILETVEKGQAGRFLEERAVRRIERFQWFLLPAIVLALLSLWRELPSLPRSRRLQKTADRQRRKQERTAAAALLIGFLLLAQPTRLSAQSMVPPEPPNPEPIREIVSRLVEQSEVQPPDWVNLARETITFGQTVKQAGQPVPAGLVYDALQGISAGEQANSDETDWEGLRSELLALLEEPDQQDQEQEQDEQDQENEDQENQDQQDQQDQDQNQQSGDQNDSQDPQQQDQQEQEEEESEEQEPSDPQEEGESSESEEQESQPEEPQQNDSEMQTIGGEDSPQELPDDPELAAAMQELEQVRNQDSPARLFRILEGEPPEDSKTKKNW